MLAITAPATILIHCRPPSCIHSYERPQPSIIYVKLYNQNTVMSHTTSHQFTQFISPFHITKPNTCRVVHQHHHSGQSLDKHTQPSKTFPRPTHLQNWISPVPKSPQFTSGSWKTYCPHRLLTATQHISGHHSACTRPLRPITATDNSRFFNLFKYCQPHLQFRNLT